VVDLQKFNREGYVTLPSFFQPSEILKIKKDAQGIFVRQFVRHQYPNAENLDDATFLKNMKRLFQEDFSTFFSCGKHCQHLVSLHRHSLDQRILNLLTDLQVRSPVISTRPVMYFNHPDLAKKSSYWKMDPHQDWRSMQGSLNAIVIWMPMVDVDSSMGALQIIPGSHRSGVLNADPKDNYRIIEPIEDSSYQSVNLQVGDALAFSSFLVHRSGHLTQDAIRWSCHFRYNDLEERTFIERGYPHTYIYKPIEELLHPEFPIVKEIAKIYEI
jgi:hypothetical protein